MLRPVALQVLVDLDEDFAHDILCIVRLDAHPIRQGADEALVAPHQVREPLRSPGQDLANGLEVIRVRQRSASAPNRDTRRASCGFHRGGEVSRARMVSKTLWM